LQGAVLHDDGKVGLQLGTGGLSAFVECLPSQYPGLSLLREGASVRVLGTIKDVTEYGVGVNLSRLEF
jgi:hypothetical protein